MTNPTNQEAGFAMINPEGLESFFQGLLRSVMPVTPGTPEVVEVVDVDVAIDYESEFLDLVSDYYDLRDYVTEALDSLSSLNIGTTVDILEAGRALVEETSAVVQDHLGRLDGDNHGFEADVFTEDEAAEMHRVLQALFGSDES